jgi:hypothetical protein
VRALALAVVLAGCGTVDPFECSSDPDCTDEQGVTGTCADPGFCAFADSTCMSGLRYDQDSAGALAGQCVGTDVGPLGDTADRPRALAPFQRIDVGNAHDDYATTCGGEDDVDIFFEITLDQPGRLYVDTFGTSFETILSIHEGACADNGAELGCFFNVCSATLQQWSDNLTAGTYCIIADRVAGQTTTTLVVRSMLGPPATMGTLGTNDGSTCANDDWQASCGPTSSPDTSWFFMSCTPITYSASTMTTQPSFDGDLQAWGLDATQLACGDGDPGIDVHLVDPGPVWLVAEALSGSDCGNVHVDVQ